VHARDVCGAVGVGKKKKKGEKKTEDPERLPILSKLEEEEKGRGRGNGGKGGERPSQITSRVQQKKRGETLAISLPRSRSFFDRAGER